MGQSTAGLRKILSNPIAYQLFQNLMGAVRFRRYFVADFVRPFVRCRILDIGCGPADILSYLPDVDYLGIDMSEAYIEQARKKYRQRGYFSCVSLGDVRTIGKEKFDIIMALGVLHHLDDEYAVKMLTEVTKNLRTGARFVSFDPCFVQNQNALARYLIGKDRGNNVRTPEKYRQLAEQHFSTVKGEVHHQSWIPYTRFIMECRQ